jgi:hypothetical protein
MLPTATGDNYKHCQIHTVHSQISVHLLKL